MILSMGSGFRGSVLYQAPISISYYRSLKRIYYFLGRTINCQPKSVIGTDGQDLFFDIFKQNLHTKRNNIQNSNDFSKLFARKWLEDDKKDIGFTELVPTFPETGPRKNPVHPHHRMQFCAIYRCTRTFTHCDVHYLQNWPMHNKIFVPFKRSIYIS